MSAKEIPATHPTVARDFLRQPSVSSAPDSTGDSGNGIWLTFKARWPEHATRVVTEIRIRQYSYRTEQAYGHWIARLAAFHKMRDLLEVNDAEIRAFLEHLVVQRGVSASTQHSALNAIVFFYKNVAKRAEIELGQFTESKKPRRLPTVLSKRSTNPIFPQRPRRAKLISF